MALNLSYWDRTTFAQTFDVLVIGGGLVGCSAALTCAAASPGLRIGVIERGPLPDGASSRNAGFACFGSLTEILSDIDTLGEDPALDLVRLRWNGLNRLLETVKPGMMDYERTGGYEIFLPDNPDSYGKAVAAMDRLNDRLASVFGGQVFIPDEDAADRLGLESVAHVIRQPYEGTLNPGKMMQALWRQVHDAGVTMLNGVTVERMEQDDNEVVLLDNLDVAWRARYVILATNAYSSRLIPDLPVTPYRNQVYLTQPLEHFKLDGCVHYNRGFVYFRPVANRLLIGGARNVDLTNESTDAFGLTERIRSELFNFAAKHIVHSQEFQFEYAWSGIIGTGPEKTPIVESIGERVVTAVRLGGMGVAIGCLVGSQAAQRILARI